MSITVEILVVLALLVINGFFALSEIAVVSSRRPRLRQDSERGNRRAAAALALVDAPTRFLSTVQIGITLIGILSGAYGGATIAAKVGTWLAGFPAIGEYGQPIAFGVVVVSIAFLSVIIGELVPKRVGLSNPERFAKWASGPMMLLSRLAAPAVWALEQASDLVIALFRLPHESNSSITESDVSAMLAAGTEAGVIEPVERRMVERIFRLNDEPIAAVMTPRRDIVWLDINDRLDANIAVMRRHPHSRFPVCDRTLDNALGILYVRDLWSAEGAGSSPVTDLRAILRQPLFIPDNVVGLDVLQQFRQSTTHMALVIDEHGGVDGLVTLNNLLLFVAGPPERLSADAPPGIAVRDASSWLVDGAVSLGDFYTTLQVADPEADRPRPYHTVAGLVMTGLGRIPEPGDRITVGPLTLEVVDMDGFRVDKLLVSRADAPVGSDEAR